MTTQTKKATRNSLSARAVAAGRRKLARLTKLGKAKGYIAQFGREQGVSSVSAYLALRGMTHKSVKEKAVPKPKVRKLKTRRRG